MLLSYHWTNRIGDHSRGGLRSLAACIAVPWKHGRAHVQAQHTRGIVAKGGGLGWHAIVGTLAVATPARRDVQHVGHRCL